MRSVCLYNSSGLPVNIKWEFDCGEADALTLTALQSALHPVLSRISSAKNNEGDLHRRSASENIYLKPPLDFERTTEPNHTGLTVSKSLDFAIYPSECVISGGQYREFHMFFIGAGKSSDSRVHNEGVSLKVRVVSHQPAIHQT